MAFPIFELRITMMPFLDRDLRQLRIGCGIWILIEDRLMGDGLNLWALVVWKVTK